MALPTIIAPEHEVKLFSRSKPVRYRPYLVKEEKLFLMAQQSDDAKDIENAVKQIVRNCTFDAIDVLTLPSFDLEYLFLKLRARSVSNVVDIAFLCANEVEGKKCGTSVPMQVNLDDVQLVVPEGHTNRFWLTDTIGVTLRYPTQPVLELAGENPAITDLLAACIETVFTKDGSVHETREQPFADVQAFVESLQLDQTDKLRTFFETMPRLEHKLDFQCPACKYTDTIVLSGLLDFFD